MKEKELRIIVDNRERDLSMLEELSLYGIDVTVAQLPVGDYIVSDRVCVERKTVQDFENSIIDNRLFEQLGRLHRSFEKPILILEGDDEYFRLNKNVVTGAMLKLYIDYNVQVLRSKDVHETAVILSKFVEREQALEKNEPRLTGIKKAYTNYEWQLLILSSLPGIGPKLARKLLDHFKTVKGVATAGIKDLQKVDKIGKKKAMRIFEILNGEFEDGIDLNGDSRALV